MIAFQKLQEILWDEVPGVIKSQIIDFMSHILPAEQLQPAVVSAEKRPKRTTTAAVSYGEDADEENNDMQPESGGNQSNENSGSTELNTPEEVVEVSWGFYVEYCHSQYHSACFPSPTTSFCCRVIILNSF